MEFLRKRTTEEIVMETAEKTEEQSNVIQRLKSVETRVKELETEVHELQLAKIKYHGDE